MNNRKWLNKLREFEGAVPKKSMIQILTSIVPFMALVTGMFFMLSMGLPYWTVLLVSIIASMFFIRTFIILHDCGHNSFFRKPRSCNIVGTICGFVTLIPYQKFKLTHNVHHAGTGNLERRGVGDIWTLTVDEYLAAGKFKRFVYRGVRSPFVFSIIGPPLLVLAYHRIPGRKIKPKLLWDTLLVDLFLLSCLVAAYFTVGLVNYILVMAPIVFISNNVGIWLFTIQHQFEDVYWERGKNWDPVKAALKGSSYYKLPALLQWATGNIGIHHVHHLRPRIPNYQLKPCMDSVPELQDVNPVTLTGSIKSMPRILWDEKKNKLIRVSDLKNG